MTEPTDAQKRLEQGDLSLAEYIAQIAYRAERRKSNKKDK